MNNLPGYTLTIGRSWFVGYHKEFDEIILYYSDEDDVVYVFRRGGVDVIGFLEYMNFTAVERLGPL